MNYLRQIIEEIDKWNDRAFYNRNKVMSDLLCDWSCRLTAIAVDAERSGWRPIVSAPMDGTLILVSYGAGAVPCIAAWVDGDERGTESYWRRHGWAANSEFVESFDEYVGVVSDLASDKVTRWMPIPK